MAATSLHKPTGRWLTCSHGWEPGQVIILSQNSYAYDSAIREGRSFATGAQWTRFTLGEPVAFTERGEPLWDLDQCDPRHPGDGSPQLDALGHRGTEGARHFLRADLRPPHRLASAIHEGRVARLSGKPEAACPYADAPDLVESWKHGWANPKVPAY